MPELRIWDFDPFDFQNLMVHNLRSSQETLRADVVSFSSAVAAMGGAHHWEQERSHAMSELRWSMKETWLRFWSLIQVCCEDFVNGQSQLSPNHINGKSLHKKSAGMAPVESNGHHAGRSPPSNLQWFLVVSRWRQVQRNSVANLNGITACANPDCSLGKPVAVGAWRIRDPINLGIYVSNRVYMSARFSPGKSCGRVLLICL